MNKKFSIPKRA